MRLIGVLIGWGTIGFGLYKLFGEDKTTTPTNKNTGTMNQNAGVPDSQKPSKISYAVFNQNPLNVKVQLDTDKIVRRVYPGEISEQGAVHKMFDNWTNGTAGGMIHLWRYINGKVNGYVYPRGTKLDTIEKIISTWAPKSDPKNDTEGYIRAVVNKLGLYRNTVIPFEEKYIKALVAAMVHEEDGNAEKSVTPSVLTEAWTIANDYLKNKV